jgi:hypothetical protein
MNSKQVIQDYHATKHALWNELETTAKIIQRLQDDQAYHVRTLCVASRCDLIKLY